MSQTPSQLAPYTTWERRKEVDIIKRPRGRPPKAKLGSGNKELKSDEIISLALREKGVPVLYVSVLKGAMAVLYDGHHFRPIFKRNRCMFYRCIRFETKKCPARILVHQGMAYPIDMAHCHEDNAVIDHGSVVINSGNISTQPKQEEPNNDNAEVEVKKESIIYEIITLPLAAPQHIINNSQKIKAEIDDIITLPTPIVVHEPTVRPPVVLPPGITIKCVGGGTKKAAETPKSAETPKASAPPYTQSTRSTLSPSSSSKATILSNEPIIPSRVSIVEKKGSVAATKASQSDTVAVTKPETKPTLEKLTSQDLKEKMKNRLKMALLKAKK